MNSHPHPLRTPPPNGAPHLSPAEGSFQEVLPDLFVLAKEVPSVQHLSESPTQKTPASAEEQNTQPLFLLIEQGPAAGQAFQIVPGSCIVGRASAADLCLKHPSVSRRHAQLKRSGNHLYVRDLGSQNGTYVNQQRISNEAEVFPGDSVIIGTSLLRIKNTLFSEHVRAKPPVHKKPAQNRKAPYFMVLVASLTASFSTLIAMVLLKLVFQPAAPAAPTSPSSPVEIPSTATSQTAPTPPPPAKLPDIPPSKTPLQNVAPSPPAPPPIDKASILEAFRLGRAENALWQAKEAKQILLAEQLATFLSQWENVESLWKEASKTKSANVRQALVVHEEALFAAARISADSHYVRELQNRIASLKQMGLRKPAPPPPPKAPARAPPSPAKPAPLKAPSSTPKELQDKQRAIDEAFNF